MHDPYTLRYVLLLTTLAFFLILIAGYLLALYLLARIFKQAKGINQRLDNLLARMSAAGPGDSKPS